MSSRYVFSFFLFTFITGMLFVSCFYFYFLNSSHLTGFVFLQEIHGVAQYAPEEYCTEKIQKSLHLLSEALASIKDKPAYDKCQEIAANNEATFVNDEIFRLKFLRAEQFNPQKAAERMVKNLNLLYRYLGSVGLTRPIRISDLDVEGLQILKLGSFQLLPFRDRSGRRIAVRIGPLGLDFIKNEKSVSLHNIICEYINIFESQSTIISTYYHHTHKLFFLYHVLTNRRADDENTTLFVSSPSGRRRKPKAWSRHDIFSFHQFRSVHNF